MNVANSKGITKAAESTVYTSDCPSANPTLTSQGPLAPPSPAAAAHAKPTGTGLNQDLDITGRHSVAHSGTNRSRNKKKRSNIIENQSVG